MWRIRKRRSNLFSCEWSREAPSSRF
ncbi:UNVERIFIED_CONTAM: hypothetical protein GTU68_067509 [Idotea baltica]|nr:hypothetical protein [Idotea baltica]